MKHPILVRTAILSENLVCKIFIILFLGGCSVTNEMTEFPESSLLAQVSDSSAVEPNSTGATESVDGSSGSVENGDLQSGGDITPVCQGNACAPTNLSEIDNDGDGQSEFNGDCDDTDITVFDGATEICGNGIDENCDGYDLSCPVIGEVDGDGDGVLASDGDCDDADPEIFPGNPEVCDGKDNDCNGLADLDDGLPRITLFPDIDDDGFGDSSNKELVTYSCQVLPHTSPRQGDCDDNDPDKPEKTVGRDENDDFSNIQDAIDTAAPGDCIAIRRGLYLENIRLNKEVSLHSIDGYEATTIRPGDANISIVSIESSNTKLVGFTIENGAAIIGAGIATANHVSGLNNILIKQNRIRNNNSLGYSTSFGAGIYISAADSVYISQNIISGNVGTHGSGAILLNLTKSTFRGNDVYRNLATVDGGAVKVVRSDITISNNRIYGNTAQGNGGGLFYEGGIASTSSTDYFVRNNIFKNNNASTGSAAYVTHNAGIYFYNNVFYANGDNHDFNNNGVVRLNDSGANPGSSSGIINNTFVFNNTGNRKGNILRTLTYEIFTSILFNIFSQSSCGVRMENDSSLYFAQNLMYQNASHNTCDTPDTFLNSNNFIDDGPTGDPLLEITTSHTLISDSDGRSIPDGLENIDEIHSIDQFYLRRGSAAIGAGDWFSTPVDLGATGGLYADQW